MGADLSLMADPGLPGSVYGAFGGYEQSLLNAEVGDFLKMSDPELADVFSQARPRFIWWSKVESKFAHLDAIDQLRIRRAWVVGNFKRLNSEISRQQQKRRSLQTEGSRILSRVLGTAWSWTRRWMLKDHAFSLFGLEETLQLAQRLPLRDQDLNREIVALVKKLGQSPFAMEGSNLWYVGHSLRDLMDTLSNPDRYSSREQMRENLSDLLTLLLAKIYSPSRIDDMRLELQSSARAIFDRFRKNLSQDEVFDAIDKAAIDYNSRDLLKGIIKTQIFQVPVFQGMMPRRRTRSIPSAGTSAPRVIYDDHERPMFTPAIKNRRAVLSLPMEYWRFYGRPATWDRMSDGQIEAAHPGVWVRIPSLAAVLRYLHRDDDLAALSELPDGEAIHLFSHLHHLDAPIVVIKDGSFDFGSGHQCHELLEHILSTPAGTAQQSF